MNLEKNRKFWIENREKSSASEIMKIPAIRRQKFE